MLDIKEVARLLKEIDFDVPEVSMTINGEEKRLYDVSIFTFLYGTIFNILKRLDKLERGGD